MKRFAAAAMVVLALATASDAAPLALQRGVGLHEWLNWSPLAADGSYRWPPYRSEAEWLASNRPASDWPAGDPLARIRALGFDFVRLSVDPGPLLATDGERRQQALDVLAADVGRLVGVGLNVVFNLQAVSQVPAYSNDLINGAADSDGMKRYREMMVAVAAMLAKIGTDRVALEPFNEPAHYPCDASGDEEWQTILGDEVKAVRAVSPDLTLVVTGACGGSITGLADIDPSFDDPDTLYSFHMYDPHSFTHQRLDDPAAFGSGLPWPADTGTPDTVVASLRAHMDATGLSEEQQTANLLAVGGYIADYFNENPGLPQLQARIGEAVTWAKAHGIPTRRLFMGEFGAILMSKDGKQGAFNADRLRYDRAVRQEAERFSIPWSIWEYANPYGMSVIVPDGPAVPDSALLTALGLD
jgi:hypothetical protein